MNGSPATTARGAAVVLFLAWSAAVPGLANACVGDCDGDSIVEVSEIAVGVEIALLREEAAACLAYTQSVEVDDLVTAVLSLGPCATPTVPPLATATPTLPEATPTTTSTPTPTNTPGGVSNAVAGGAAVVAKSLAGIPSLITGIVTGLVRGEPTEGGGSAGGAGAGGACPLSGTATRNCTPMTGGGARLSLGLLDCGVATPDGSLVLNTPNDIILISQTGTCPTGINPFSPGLNAIADVRGEYRDTQQQSTLSTRATLTAVVNPVIPFPLTVCVVSGAGLTVTGSLTSVIPGGGGGAVLSFAQTSANLTIQAFNTDCVPVRYTLTFNGPATLRDTSTAEVADISFANFVVTVDSTTTPTTFSMDGGLNFDCVQGSITLDTTTALTSIAGEICPDSGTIEIMSSEGPATIEYGDEGVVRIDVDHDGTFDNSFDSCLDPMLQLCPQVP